MSKLVSVIVPAYNLPDYTIACLEAIQRNTAYKPIEIILVDNGSEPESRQQVDSYLDSFSLPFQAIRLEENEGWVGGCWAGYKEATGSYIVLLNNDTEPAQGWLTAMIKALEADPGLGIVGCITQNKTQWQGIPKLREKWPELRGAPEEGQAEWLKENCASIVKPVHGMVAFFAATLRRKMLDEIGFLNPHFGIGLGDDDELCHRARVRGWRIGVALDSYVHHHHRTTFRELLKEGVEWRDIQRRNTTFLYWKQSIEQPVKGVNMDETIPVVFKYLGNKDGFPWVVNIPARDLDWDDIMYLEMERNISTDDIMDTGLYLDMGLGEPKSVYGPEPFCGAVKADGTRCKRKVEEWGMRCWQHPKETQADEEVYESEIVEPEIEPEAEDEPVDIEDVNIEDQE